MFIGLGLPLFKNWLLGGGGSTSPSFTVLFEPLTNSTGTVTTLAYINAATGSGTITPSVTESRSSGVAPLAVFFDATGTTSTETTRPQHDIFYAWDFGDSGAGTWSYGTGVHTNKNLAYGPVAAHVFETAGTHTVTLTTFDGVSTTTTTKTITVTAANTEWATTKTICLANGAEPVPGVNGVPTGATCVGSVTNMVTAMSTYIGSGNVRILLKAGDTFTGSTPVVINQGGPSMLGAFGTGAKPIVSTTSTTAQFALSSSATPTTVSDWRFVGLNLTGDYTATAFHGQGSFSKVLVLNCDVATSSNFVKLAGSDLASWNSAANTPHAMWDEMYLVGNTFFDLKPGDGNGANTVFANCRRFVALGNDIDNNDGGEHGIRMQLCDRGVFSNNTIKGINNDKVNLTIRGGAWAGNNAYTAGEYSEKIVISDNDFVGGPSVGMIGCGPQNYSNDERGRNMIFERNIFTASTTTQNLMSIQQPDVTVRNNLVYYPATTNGGSFVSFVPSGISPNPTRCNVYNNSVYFGGTSSNTWSLMATSSNNEIGAPFDQDMPDSVFDCKNNVLHAPNYGATSVAMFLNLNGALSTTTTSNNTASDYKTNPGWATNPPTLPAHFVLSGGSYANAAGTAVKNWRDFYGTLTQSTPDMGAIVI